MKPQMLNFPIFVQSPELQIPNYCLNLENPNPNFTLQDLKSCFLDKTQKSFGLIKDLVYFTFDGRPMKESTLLCSSGISPFSTLVLRLRLRGGGGDGGATGAESRDCYLKMYATKKPDKIDPNEIRLSRWLNCALSNEPLKHPVVVDKLGNLFNKEALVEALLKKSVPKQFGYVKGLKDMIPVELDVIPGKEDRGLGDGEGTGFQCPVTGLEFNGKYKFFALKGCGHVLSAKALKEVKSSACLVCHKEIVEGDKIVINGSEEEVAVLRERMEEEKAKLKDNKKVKKGKSGDVAVNGEEVMGAPRLSGMKHGIEDKVAGKDVRKVEGNGKVGINSKIEVKDVKCSASNGPVKRFKAVDVAPAHATKEVYASIFTSSSKSDFKETYSCRSLPLGRN
ncbi:hypothetical protein CQW23_16361 [Capsicum baccatum]|uniref:Ubiquitin-like domain-containing protein n=2 Tax=Capsicum TaxID=4071 RepID=A0A1U8H8L2_CAPAN|nr:replication termination factor 2 [Capsicum annuum]KAF3665983.1 putative glycerophosphoryl diester phosphodiesterase 3-like [Capsicum annuum]PHT42336.1 hypothetical protein CQW23_16361 [Capsicum baccatum]PHT75367.1 hypothetical protein T459_18889 [Capsicum annuum]